MRIRNDYKHVTITYTSSLMIRYVPMKSKMFVAQKKAFWEKKFNLKDFKVFLLINVNGRGLDHQS